MANKTHFTKSGTTLAILACLALWSALPTLSRGADEIHSNGRGGGAWSDPATWHGGRVPGPEDVAVIAMRDQVSFDRNDSDRVTCRALYLDPEAVLQLRVGREDLLMVVGGPIESYGTIRMDGTEDPRVSAELRLTGADKDRVLRLMQNGALLVYGNEHPRGGVPNIRLRSGPPDTNPEDRQAAARIIADGEAMIDLHHAGLHDVSLQAARLDNSGGSRDRLNLIGNHFSGLSQVVLVECDSPVIRDNRFETEEDAAPETALSLNQNALARVQGTTITGPYGTGLHLQGDTSSMVSDLKITGVREQGLHFDNATDTAVKDAVIQGDDGKAGIRLVRSTPVLEQITVDGFHRAIRVREGAAQLTNCDVAGWISRKNADDEETGAALWIQNASVRLVNSPINPEEVILAHTNGPPDDEYSVETLQYLLVRALAPDNGDLPSGLRVRLQTAKESGGPPSEGADLNVRNSPTIFSEQGITPAPMTRRALVLRGWSFDPDGNFVQAPFYDLIIEKHSGDSRYETVVREVIEPRPSWFREDLRSTDPTLEIELP